MQRINEFFTGIFDILNRQENHVLILAVYLCVAVGVVALRVLAHLRYKGAVTAVEREAPLKNRTDVAKIRNILLRTAVAHYKRVADAAVTRVPTERIVARAMDKMHFAGWRYGGMCAFVEGFEAGLLWMGLILAVMFTPYAHVYGTLAVVIFVLLRLCASFFDFRAARESLSDEMLIFIEREVGRFYASDAPGAVLRLKNELSEANERLTEGLTGAIKLLATVVSDNTEKTNETIKNTTADIHTQIAEAIDAKLARMTGDLSAAADSWQQSLTEAAGVQSTVNRSAVSIEKAGGKLQSAAELLSSHLQGHSNALSEQLVALVRAVESVKEAQTALTRQGGYIERNQQTLDDSLHAYEAALQGLTQNLGESLGAFVNVHAQNSAQAVNDALRNNIEKIMQLSINNRGGA